MRRKISSSITGFHKVSILLIFLIIISVSLFNILIKPDSGLILFTSLMMLLGFFIIRWILNLKKVELTEKGIFVSAGSFGDGKEIFVPFEQIEAVGQGIFTRGNPEFVSIRFSAATAFGDKIWFIPKTRFFPLLKHPVVDEINWLANRSKGYFS